VLCFFAVVSVFFQVTISGFLVQQNTMLCQQGQQMEQLSNRIEDQEERLHWVERPHWVEQEQANFNEKEDDWKVVNNSYVKVGRLRECTMRQWEEWADMATVVAFGGYCLRSTGT
jgi:hypothetical protein